MRVIYIAGPFRAENAWEVEQNIRLAETAALAVWRYGAVPLCPHTMNRFYQGAASVEVWLKGDLELLRRCDAVLVVGDFTKSVGTREEIRVATEEMKIPVFYDQDCGYAIPPGMRAWLGGQR